MPFSFVCGRRVLCRLSLGWFLAAAMAGLGRMGSAQELPGGSEEEFARNRQLLREWIATPEAVMPLTEIFGLRFSTKSLGDVRGRLASTAKSKQAGPLIRARANFFLSQMDVEAGDLEAAIGRRRAIGTIMDWFVIGAFENEGKAGFEHAYPPEKSLQFGGACDGELGKVKWRETARLFPLGDVNLFDLFRPNLKALAYAAAFVEVAEPATLALRLGSDDSVKVWLNGKLVHSNNVYRPMTFDQDAVPVRLGAGWNRILLKVCQDAGEWEFRARLTRPDGRPFTAFRTASRMDAASSLKTVEPQSPGKVKAATLLSAFEAKVKRSPKSARAHGHLAWLYAHAMPFEITERRHEAAYQRAISLAPWYPGFYYELGRIAQEPNLARHSLRKSLALAPEFARARYLLASHYAGRGNYRKAMKLVELAIKQEPNFLPSHLLKADMLGLHYAEPLALDALKAVRDRFPNAPALLLRMASISEDLGQLEDAHGLRSATLKISHFNRDARLKLANEAKARGELPAFRSQYEELAKLTPTDTELMLAQAQLLRAWQEPASAAALCRRALEVCPKDAAAAELLGRCLHDQGKTHEAMNAWELSLALKPQNPALKEYVEFVRPGEAPLETGYVRDVEEVIKTAPDSKRYPHDSVVCLLDLTVRRVYRNGLDSSFRQVAYKVLTVKGTRDLSSYPIAYTRNSQRCITKKARVIKPTGEVAAIAPASTRRYGDDAQLIHYDVDVKVFSIPGLGVGDVVEIQYQIDDVGSRNERGDYFSVMEYLHGDRPCKDWQYVLITPRERKLYCNTVGVSLKPEVTEKGKDTVRIWRLADTPGLVKEPHMPGYTEVGPYLHGSTFESWDDMGRWCVGLYRDQFALDERGKKLAQKVTAGKKTDLDKVKALHNYLARHTRYLGLEFGIHGNKPYPAWQVLARGYGDCKDKATLLCSLLHEVGVKASVALIRTRGKGRIHPYPPSLFVFNHAIAYVPKYKLWLDCTVRYSGATELPAADQGTIALILDRDGTSRFTTVPCSKAEVNRYVQRYRIDLRGDGTGDVRLAHTITGCPAGGYRAAYAVESERLATLAKKWGGRFPGSSVSDVDFSDLTDLESPVRYSCGLAMPGFAARDRDELAFDNNLTRYRMVEQWASLSQRRRPLVLGAPFQSVCHTTVRLPKGYHLAAKPADVDLATPFGRFERTCAAHGDRITIHQTFQVDAWQVAVPDYPAWRRFCMTIDEKLGEKIRISR